MINEAGSNSGFFIGAGDFFADVLLAQLAGTRMTRIGEIFTGLSIYRCINLMWTIPKMLVGHLSEVFALVIPLRSIASMTIYPIPKLSSVSLYHFPSYLFGLIWKVSQECQNSL